MACLAVKWKDVGEYPRSVLPYGLCEAQDRASLGMNFLQGLSMSIKTLSPEHLSLRIDRISLGFTDTAELLTPTLPWIGQERAEQAARFGWSMDQPDYNLFVLGAVGSGRASLLRQLTRAVAADRPVPPDLCYLHNFDAPERPRALRMPAGQGRELRTAWPRCAGRPSSRCWNTKSRPSASV
jgi:hypothetical protein